MKEEEKENTENREQENVVKITITRESAEALAELVVKVNEGFEAGRVHRQDIASWIITRFRKNHSDIELAQIRQVHYNDAAMFEALYRRMKETGEMPEFLKDVMRKQFSGNIESKKAKKHLNKEYISDVSNEDSEAA